MFVLSLLFYLGFKFAFPFGIVSACTQKYNFYLDSLCSQLCAGKAPAPCAAPTIVRNRLRSGIGSINSIGGITRTCLLRCAPPGGRTLLLRALRYWNHIVVFSFLPRATPGHVKYAGERPPGGGRGVSDLTPPLRESRPYRLPGGSEHLLRVLRYVAKRCGKKPTHHPRRV